MNPNGSSDNLTQNSRQYTPIYLIQNSSITQGRSYVLAPTLKEEPKPVSGSLKLFYENSGNIENNAIRNEVPYIPQPIVQSKPEPEQLGNNLKLASFLVPKKDVNKQHYIATISNRILGPSVKTNNANILPNINIITPSNGARNKANANSCRTLLKPRILPKIQPKEQSPGPEPSQHTSVQLLKLGGKYHSLNKLSDKQLSLVNKALENLPVDPEKATLKPSYDPVTKTRIVYKVVSPNDLKVVGKNNLLLKTNSSLKKQKIVKDLLEEDTAKTDDEKPEPVQEVKVTRSGRTVKLPKHIQETQEDPLPKAKKKPTVAPPIITCFHCSVEFSSIYRLQRHYEKHPTHSPSNIHSNLFHCFLSMMQNGTDEEKTSVFIRQLEELIDKLKSVLPCLLKKVDGSEGTQCNINQDVGRLFGIDPGNYNLHIDAVHCKKDEHGHCKHNPPKFNQFSSDLSKPSQMWLSKHQEETANVESEGEDCARINSVDKWPIKRIWKRKANDTENNTSLNKKLKIICDTIEPHIELGNEDLGNIVDAGKIDVTVLDKDKLEEINCNVTLLKEASLQSLTEIKQPKTSQVQFYSTHFDIRSSPIKPSTTVFNKFQIVPEKIPLKFDGPHLRPLTIPHDDPDQESSIQGHSDNSLDLNGMFKELTQGNNENTHLPTENLEESHGNSKPDLHSLSFPDPKEWSVSTNIDPSHDNEIKPNSLIVPAMLHVQDNIVNASTTFDNSSYNNSSTNYNINDDNNMINGNNMINDNQESLNQGASVLNFLEALGNDLAYPETELRNNSIDFPLDLFTFTTS